MLGWAIKKGIQSATGATDAPTGSDDTTQFEAPDTPAPIFAARAIKHAIFGTPAPAQETDERRVEAKLSTTTASLDARPDDFLSPTRPAGILLTPGTGNARRKRVSFGHDVKAGNNGLSNVSTAVTGKPSANTRLQLALEDSRKSQTGKKNLVAAATHDATDKSGPSRDEELEDDDNWVDDVCNHDVTVDLNDPHSNSGKYWKSEFAKYASEARQEMERLVKYKHLAKLYAEKKDAEAVDLNQKLKEEHEKVAKMERQITDVAAFMGDKTRRGDHSDNAALMAKLSEQSALAVQYRLEVKELEALLKKQQDRPEVGKPNRRIDTSPGTEKTLLEVQRELRWANAELRKMERMRKEVEKLKSDLHSAQERTAQLEKDKKTLLEATIHSAGKDSLEKELQRMKEDSRKKDEKLNSLKEDAKLQLTQARQVLGEKNGKIATLEAEVRTLRKTIASANSQSRHLTDAAHQRSTSDLRASIESLGKPSKHDRVKTARSIGRSASAEDLTLDTGKSDRPGPMFLDDDLNSLDDMKEQLRRHKMKRMVARQSDEVAPTRSANAESALSSSALSNPRRVMADRHNNSSPNDDVDRASSHQSKGWRPAASARDKAVVLNAMEGFAAPKHTSRSSSGRPQSSGSDEVGFDLVQDRFAKLGVPDANGTQLGANTSRCTIPADRQAAAKARLERKRRERHHGGGRDLDKENLQPH